jgi:C4-type Zn-finger protein
MALQEKRSFAADDHPSCPQCGKEMYLSRRSPHPRHGSGFELQTFSCNACNYEEERSVEQGGAAYRC